MCWWVVIYALVLSFVCLFEGTFLGMILVTHYLLHYIGNIYLAVTFDVSFITVVLDRLLRHLFEARSSDVLDLELIELDSLPANIRKCLLDWELPSYNSTVHTNIEAVARCVNAGIFNVGVLRRVVFGLMVLFRALHSMALINDFSGRTLNYPSRASRESSVIKKVYTTIIFLTAVVANAFEIVINGSILIECTPNQAGALWTTAFFRLFKNCFVDMGLMIKTFHRSRHGWTDNEKISGVAFALLFIASFIAACFMIAEFNEKVEHQYPNHTDIFEPVSYEKLCNAIDESNVFPAAYPALLATSQVLFILDRFFFTLTAVDHQC